MSYQVRHVRLGIFQGMELTAEGAAMCYHPAADTPEMGFYEFPTPAAAAYFINWALSVPTLGYKKDEFLVELFNKEGSALVQERGLHFITMEHWARLLKIRE